MEKWLTHISADLWRRILLALIAFSIWAGISLALRLHTDFLFALPLVAALALLVIYNYKPVFYLLIASIPFSMQIEPSKGTAVDVFSEPLMLVLLAVFLIQAIAGRQFDKRERLHTFHLLIFLILFWTLVTTIASDYPIRSFKFLLAKIWYLVSFIYIGGKVLDRPESVRTLFWTFFFAMAAVVSYITVLHAMEGFSFESAHNISNPIFANGVIYASTLSLFIPWVWYSRSWYTPKSLEWYVINVGLILFVVATVLTYKRAAWVSLAILPIIDISIRRRIFDKLVAITLVVGALLVVWLVSDNQFYSFAPNYKKTIWHEGDIEGHLKATFSGTEISSMERFYRWVAAKNMIADMPFAGSGPSTFNQVYKGYADDAFRTYVSDNPEQSTTHNYFLHTFAEQGVIGGLLFLSLVIYMLVKGARLRPQIRDPYRRSILMMVQASLTVIMFLSIFNEMIEVDKVGGMFWICLLLIHKSEKWNEESQSGIEKG